ncbi:hypothetical protein EIN_425450 [Entamoeba invadens IP1]|uniref:VTT domain-containing protein n=1 Tax=Entamoeba invadens IP1 TaxID=370355 RepID=A0A0A1U606_ENTIV|nr:hypothetical protein EIN_425450 [Entamoeba invadens IP1]ELP89813.1 hypothetical protein EIN_425450 [Entamoeba invadens IP1]|eukprot:XP_004256584.1 hypothetical protein EIN_425450 [Entamoeba invadens IP1]
MRLDIILRNSKEIKMRILTLIVPSFLLFVSITMNLPSKPLKRIILGTIEHLSEIQESEIAYVLFILCNCASLLLFIPISMTTMAGGFIFGMYKGTMLSVIGRNIGSVLPYCLGKLFGKELAEAYSKKNEWFECVVKILSTKIHLLCLFRTCPFIPFTLTNYLLAPFVKPKEFFFATFVATIPASLLYTYLGTLVHDVVNMFSTDDFIFTVPSILFLVFALALIIAFFVGFGYFFKKEIKTGQRTEKKKQKKIYFLSEVSIPTSSVSQGEAHLV